MPKFLEVTDKSAARNALEFNQTVSSLRTHVDLRDFANVQAAQWKTFLGGALTAGSTTMTGTQFTSADVGKIVMCLVDSAARQWFMTTLVSVSGSTAVLADAAPVTLGPLRVRYGFDGAAAINGALQQINSAASGPTDVYLGGSYRLSQLVIPSRVALHGVKWSTNDASGNYGVNGKTTLTQIPGADKNFVVFEPLFGSAVGASALTGFDLWGPEKNVIGLPAATVVDNGAGNTKGHGVCLETPTGTPLQPIDGFYLDRVSAYNFPGSGFRFYGVVPFYMTQCKALFNGRYGVESNRFGGNSTVVFHLQDFSCDWNNLGGVLFRNLREHDAVFINNMKSEGNIDGAESNWLRGGPNNQSNGVVLQNNHPNSLVMINGLSHIRVDRASAYAGPAILVEDSTATGLRPRIAFNSVMERITGTETTGNAADAVTLKDTTTTPATTIPATVNSGFYPDSAGPYLSAPTVKGGAIDGSTLQSPRIANDVLDSNGNKIFSVVPASNATASFVLYNNSAGNALVIAAQDPTQVNLPIALAPKGDSSIQIGGSAPRISATGTNKNLNLQSSGTGVVQANGQEVETVNRKGVANGYAGLDAGGKLPIAQLPTSAMQWQGVWNADTNSPTLADGTGDAGDVFRVSVAGTRNLGSGSVTYSVGDLVIYDGSVWQRSDSTDSVTTVNGYTGTVVLSKSDLSLGNVDNTADANKSVASAATLVTGRTVQVNLASTSSATFNGSANISPGVTGTLPVSNGGTGATSISGVVRGNGTGAFTAAAYSDIAAFDPDLLTTGQETMPRQQIQTSAMPSTNGNLRLTYFTARKTETITQVRVPTGSTAGVSPTLCRVGLYTVAGNGDLTLVASTANDTSLWIAANTAYTKALSSSYEVTAGTRYALGLLVVGSTTAPQFSGSGPGGNAAQFATAPRLAGLVGSRTDLDATINSGSVTDSTNRYFAALVP